MHVQHEQYALSLQCFSRYNDYLRREQATDYKVDFFADLLF